MGAERLTLIRSESDVRHGDAKYRQAQRLAWWAIGLATVSLTGAIAFAVAQFLTKPPTRENWPADMGATLAPVYAIVAPTSTPTATAKGSPRTKHRSQRRTAKKADSHGPVERFFRSLLPPRPTQTPSAVRRR